MIESVVAMANAVTDFLQRYWVHIVGSIAALVASIRLSAVMRRLDQGAVEGIGASLIAIVALFVVTIVAVHVVSGGSPHAPYGAALAVLASGVCIWFTQRLRSFRLAETRPAIEKPRQWVRVTTELDALASSSALLLVVACSLLLAILWIVGVGVRPPLQAQAEAQPVTLTPTDFLARAAAAGLLAMAIIQGIRTLVPIRGAFHRASLQRWVSDSARAAGEPPSPSDVPTTAEETRIADPQKPSTGSSGTPAEPATLLMEIAALASPASGSQRYALFDLPIEQLCGQIAAGADRLLDNPPSAQARAAVPANQKRTEATSTSTSPVRAPESPHPSASSSSARAGVVSTSRVLRALAASSDDVERFLQLSEPAQGPAAATPSPPPPDPTKSDAKASAPGQKGMGASESQNGTLVKDSRERMRLRANISQRIQRNIDRLQIDTTFWWKRLLRGLAVAVCGVLGLSALNGSLSAVVFAIVGGFVATVARDVVAIVEKSRR